MKIQTPEGLKDAEPLDFSLEDAERPVKVTVADGTVLLCRATIAAVFRYQTENGEAGYYVNHAHSVVKIS